MAGEENFLSRWSRRKSQADASVPEKPKSPEGSAPGAAATPPAAVGSATPERAEAAPLPPLESLTTESDFSPFMSPEVDGDTRRKALKTLFADPRFNTMDMMDVYVDDYSKPDPIPASWLDNLEQISHLGDRAGRDREEEKRLRALAEERATATDTPPADPAAAENPPALADTPEGEAAGPPHEGVRAPDAEALIPPEKVGESGA